jgi:anti-sigma B factor antagonist
MNLQIEQRERERVVILDLKGWLVLGEEDLSLLQRLLFLLDSRHRQVILNIKEVSTIDESGLDTVVFCAARFHEMGGRLVILDLGQSRATVADISKLSTVSDTYQEETEAVNSFFPDPIVPRYDILEFVNAQKESGHRKSSSAECLSSNPGAARRDWNAWWRARSSKLWFAQWASISGEATRRASYRKLLRSSLAK